MLHTKEIFMLGAMLCFVSFLVLFSFKGNGVAAIRPVLLGSVLGMVGNILYAFGKELPLFFAYEVANFMYAAATAAVFAGYRQLFNRPTHAVALMVALAAFTGLISFFHYVFASFAVRTLLASLFQACMAFGICWTVFTCRADWRKPYYPKFLILATAALIGSGHVGRIFHQFMTFGAPKSLLEPTAGNALILAAGAFALPILAFGAMMLVHRRIVVMAEDAANRDYLTGAWSRRAFYEIGERELVRALRTDRPLSVLLIDMDNFKPINDTFGHDIGDRTLELFARRTEPELRSIDYLCRMGGDEFAVLLPETTLAGAEVVAHRLKDCVEKAPRPDFMDNLTLSIGVATLEAGDNLKSLVKRADVALYAAKDRGRNQIALQAPKPTIPRLVISN